MGLIEEERGGLVVGKLPERKEGKWEGDGGEEWNTTKGGLDHEYLRSCSGKKAED